MVQELLYDYVSGVIDQDRKQAVEDYIFEHPEMRHELKLILEAEKYAQHLSQTRLSPKYVDELQDVRSLTEKIIFRMKWQNWPDFLKWTTEALSLSALIAAGAIFIPWGKLESLRFKDIQVLTPVQQLQQKPVAEPPAEIKTVDTQPDKSVKAKASDSISTQKEKAKPAVVAVVEQKAPEPVPAKMTDESSEQPVSKLTASESTKLKGLLFRVMLDLENSDAKTTELRQKIISLGGVKAGQVELGWRKKDPNGNYYHFTMPESNYQQLITTLGGYGPVRIYKNPHERVMPEGQIRIILWVEDKVPSPKIGP